MTLAKIGVIEIVSFEVGLADGELRKVGVGKVNFQLTEEVDQVTSSVSEEFRVGLPK